MVILLSGRIEFRTVKVKIFLTVQEQFEVIIGHVGMGIRLVKTWLNRSLHTKSVFNFIL